jgi:Protein of unknown function (DUF1573)
MKKIIITLSLALSLSSAFAQVTPSTNTALPVTPAVQQEVYDFDKFIKLNKEKHDFGKLPQGPTAATEFTITNISKEPITIETVQPSCGCTVPDWTKGPIEPGANATIKAVYNTANRPGAFNKTLTIKTNRGQKPVFITGEVETAPVGSVPPAENSMIKHQ